MPTLEWLFDPQQHPKHKADVNTQTVDESTVLSLAVQFANPADEEQHTLHRAACVDFLLAKGADFSTLKYKAFCIRDNYFTGADLSSAVIKYSAHVVRTLIEVYKVNVTTNILVNAAGRDPAIFAIALSHYP